MAMADSGAEASAVGTRGGVSSHGATVLEPVEELVMRDQDLEGPLGLGTTSEHVCLSPGARISTGLKRDEACAMSLNVTATTVMDVQVFEGHDDTRSPSDLGLNVDDGQGNGRGTSQIEAMQDKRGLIGPSASLGPQQAGELAKERRLPDWEREMFDLNVCCDQFVTTPEEAQEKSSEMRRSEEMTTVAAVLSAADGCLNREEKETGIHQGERHGSLHGSSQEGPLRQPNPAIQEGDC